MQLNQHNNAFFLEEETHFSPATISFVYDCRGIPKIHTKLGIWEYLLVFISTWKLCTECSIRPVRIHSVTANALNIVWYGNSYKRIGSKYIAQSSHPPHHMIWISILNHTLVWRKCNWIDSYCQHMHACPCGWPQSDYARFGFHWFIQ